MGQPQNIGPGDIAASERRAQEFLAAGRFRKARDEFKLLCKIDRAKYLPLLVRANQGLVKEMLAKGLVSEAEQVIAYLKTIASPAELKVLELEAASRSNDQAKVVASSISLLADPASNLPEADRWRMADHLVLAFQPVVADGPGTAQLAAELRAVHGALQAVAAEQYDHASDLLRPLPHHSSLSHWKLFIKGLTAFHLGDSEKMNRLFAGLPQDSVTAKASQPYRLLASQAGNADLNSKSGAALLGAICRLARTPSLGPLLIQAEQWWRASKYEQSYLALRRSLAEFPSENLDALGALSAFYFNVIFALPGEDADSYCDFFEHLEYTQQTKNNVERLWLLRTLALFLESSATDLRMYWEGFLKIHEQMHGAEPRLASLVYAHLGAVLSIRRAPSPFIDPSHSVLRDSNGAIECLQKSISLDPTNLAAHLNLCQVYELLNLSSPRNRLLDTMTERFPHEKSVLVEAGRLCLERQALTKGLEYLQSALELDRLDPTIPELLVAGKIELAKQAFRKARPEKAREVFSQINEHLVENSRNLARGRWTGLVHEAVLELGYGERQRAHDLLTKASAICPAPVTLWFFAKAAYLFHGSNSTEPFPHEGELAAAAKSANASHAALLLQIHAYWRAKPEARELYRLDEMLHTYLKKAAKQPFTREEAQTLAELSATAAAFRPDILPFVEKMLKQDKRDPLFRLYRYMMRPFALEADDEDDRLELESIISEAARRADDKTAQLARKWLNLIEARREREFQGQEEEPEAPWGQEEDYHEEPPIAPDAADIAILKDMVRMAANATAGEIAEMRRSLPKEISKEFFDALIAAARGRRPLPPLPPPVAPPPAPIPTVYVPGKPKPPAPNDPNQMELF